MRRPDFTAHGSRMLFAVVLADLVSFGMLMPLLPSYASRFGATPLGVGVLVASYSLMHLVLAPWWGRLSDRVGRRPVLLIGFAGSVAASLLFAWADSVLWLLASRVLAGGLGATINVAQAYYADMTPKGGRTRAMGLLGAAYGLGFIIGPGLGGIASLGGDPWPGYLAALVAGGSLATAWWALPEPERSPPEDPAPDEQAVEHPPSHLLAAGFCGTLAFTVMYVVFPLFSEATFGFTRAEVSGCFVLLGLVNAAAQGALVGRLVPRYGEVSLMRWGGGLMAAGFVLLPLSTVASFAGPGGLFWAALVLVALGYGLIGPAVAGALSRTGRVGNQGLVLGVLQRVNAAARVIGPVLAGGLSSWGGATAAFLLSAGAGMGAALLGRNTRSGPASVSGGR